VLLDSRTGDKRDYSEIILKDGNISKEIKSQNT
jgi:hypothetical protein